MVREFSVADEVPLAAVDDVANFAAMEATAEWLVEEVPCVSEPSASAVLQRPPVRRVVEASELVLLLAESGVGGALTGAVMGSSGLAARAVS